MREPSSGAQHIPDETRTASTARGISRRSVTRGAAWAAPAVAFSAMAPAIAASGTPDLINLTTFGTVQQCGTVAAGVVTFQATLNGKPVKEGEKVAITLPNGLKFPDGSASVTLATGPSGIVEVPSFRATGASGSYSIQAAFNNESGTTATAFAVGEVTPLPGSIVQLTRTPGTATATPTILAKPVTGITDGVAGSISGDQTAGSAGANVAVVTKTGTVRLWGNTFGTSTPPGTLQYDQKTITGITTVSTWTSVGTGDDSAGGVAAGTTEGSVYQWFRKGTGAGTPAVVRIAGISGTVLSVEANERFSYALTSKGIYYWLSAATGSGTPATLTATGPLSGTSGAREMSTWSSRTPSSTTITYGGAVLLGDGTLRRWTGTSTNDSHTLSTIPGAPTGVASLQAVDSALYVLTTGGDLYTVGTAFKPDVWTRRATDVATFHAWGFTGYTGGLYVAASRELMQFFSASAAGKVWTTERKTGSVVNGTTVTQVFASDGTYLALTSDSRVHAWAGNLDNSGRTAPQRVESVTDASDLEVWGFHQPGGDFYGGGYVISSQGGCR